MVLETLLGHPERREKHIMSIAREHETTFAAAYADNLTIRQRETLAQAAVALIDQTFDDLAATERDRDQGLGWDPANISLFQWLPRRYRRHYDRAFLRAFLITLSTVVWKLAQPLVIPLSSTAEQLAAHALIASTRRHLEARRQGQGHHGHGGDTDFQAFARALYPDLDTGFLFEDARDGLDAGELMFGEWFAPFEAPTEDSANATPVYYPYVHPYGPYGPTAPEA